MKKVCLRAMEPEDLELLYGIENDREQWDVGVTNVPYSRYLLRDYIARATGDIYVDKQVRLMVENTAGQTVGIVDLVDFQPRHLRAEVGIVILREHRRKGYATEAVSELLDYARDVLHLHQLYAVVPERNIPSRRLFTKNGFHASMELKDWLRDGDGYQRALVMQTFL